VTESGRRAVAAAPCVVALRALGLGDLLTGVPALRALARGYPDHEVVLVAPRSLAPLARHARAADRIVVADGIPAPGTLPDGLLGAAVAVNLHGRGPSSHRGLLATRPQRLIAFANTVAGVEGPQWKPQEHEVHRWCRLLAESGVAADPEDLDVEPPGSPSVRVKAGTTVIHPGAGSPSRRWPPSRWAQVAAHEAATGRAVLLTGSATERSLAESVAREAGLAPESVVAGRTDALKLASLVGAAGRVVSTDTGIAHLATALRTPSVVLFGPTSPAEWGPPPSRSWHRVLWLGRTGDPHARRPDPGLLAISVAEVLEALDSLPDAGPGVAPSPRSFRGPHPVR
jgi:ADP-heptose:LPS heptosyltransferase